jgi:hypothetical protein
MQSVIVFVSVTLCLIVIVLHTVFTYEYSRVKIYDCTISEISADYPIEVKEECRKLKRNMI